MFLADIIEPDRHKVMCDGIEADTIEEAKEMVKYMGRVSNIKSMETHHRCPNCGKIIPKKKEFCGTCAKEL